MNAHMTEPHCLTEAIDSRCSFPEGFAGTGKWFRQRRGMFRQKRAGSSAGQTIVEGIRPLGRQPARDLAHDRNDLLHDITADAAGSTSQQILDGSSDLCFGLVRVHKIPIALV
jgi:hypothetical protein